MTAAVTMNNGKAEMAYTGEVPWHGLGQVLEPGASIETWLESAGMSHKLLRAFVRYPTSRDNVNDPASWAASEDNVVIFRGDNFKEMGVVSKKFQLVQPRETLEFFRDLVGAAGCELSTAGTLFDGRKYWAMATIGAESVIADKRDTVRANLLLSTACDGSMATEARFCATRVVCNNTLQLAKGERGNAGVVRVTHRSKFDPQAVKAELGIESAISQFDLTIARMRELADAPMSQDLMLMATCGLLKPDYAELDEKGKHRVLNSKPVETIARLAIDNKAIGSDMSGANGTAYAWLNAVTQYVDHDARAKSDSHRMDSAFFGKNVAVKDRAFEMASVVAATARENGAMQAVNVWLEKTGIDNPASLLDSVIDETAPM